MNGTSIRAILMVLTPLLLSACHTQEEEQPHLEEFKIVATSPKSTDVVITQQYVCQIHSQRHIEVRALKSGYLERIPIREGQAVKHGDLMFKIVPILYQAKLNSEIAEARVAEIDVKNAERLLEKKFVSPQELAMAQAKLAKAQANVELAQAELNFTEVKAPFDGIVDRLHEQQGSLVEEGDILTTLSDNSLMWVYFNVPEVRYLEYKADLEQDKAAANEANHPVDAVAKADDVDVAAYFDVASRASDTQLEDQSKADVQHEVQPQADVQHEDQPQADVQHEVQPQADVQHEVQPQADVQHEVQPQADVQHEDQPQTDPDPQSDAEHRTPSTQSQVIELVLANRSKFPHSGHIGAIEGQFNNETGNIAFRADFPNPEGLLRHGQTGNVLIHRTMKDAIVIPQRAVFEILDKRYVFTVDKDHIVHQREVVVLHEMEDIFVLKSGLQVNEKFILEGVRQVHDGEKVEYEFADPEEAMANQKYHAE